MTVLEICMLGGLALQRGGTTLSPIAGRVARSLFAYLAFYRDRPHTRDLLAGTFWPDLSDGVARRRLSRALWEIGHHLDREVPAGPVVVASGAAVQLNPALPVWLDVEQLVEQHARCNGGGADALRHGERCLELYRGEFLAGYYDDWLLQERERLRNMFLVTLQQVAAAHKARADYAQALAYTRRWVEEDPWSEQAHCEVMRLYHLLEQDAEALRQYEACCRMLAEELGIDPAPETTALAREIAARSGAPVSPLLPSGAGPRGTPQLERPDRLPLVGRQVELAELLREMETAAHGHGGMTLVYGEAGVGKTRLLRELADNARWRGLPVYWGRCYELAAPLAYQPLVEAMRAGRLVLERSALPPVWRAELARLVPELAVEGALLPPLVPEEEQRRLLEAIVHAFLALAGDAPTLVLLEDAQWIDLASLEALRYLLPRLAGVRLHVVLSARRQEMAGPAAALLTALEETRLPRRLDLGRLNLEGTTALVQHVLGLERPASRFSARLHAETDGNPFFLVETLWTLVQEGTLVRDEGGDWSTSWDSTTADYAELPLPAGVAQSIAHRLARLPAALLEPLCMAAVIGRDVDFRLWRAASGCPEDELLTRGDELCTRGLLLSSSDPRVPSETGATRAAAADYTFAHDLIRRVAYERLSTPRRRTYHRRVAEALRLLDSGQPATLAYHWTQAEVWDQAAREHRRAGDQARAVYANAAAVEHYTQALEALERLPGPPDLAEQYGLLLGREAAHSVLGARPEQQRDLESLDELALALNDGQRQAEVALRQAAYSIATDDIPGAVAAARRAIDLAQSVRDPEREATGHLRWGYALIHQDDLDGARLQVEAALAIARAQQLREVEAEGLRHLGSTQWLAGDYAQAGVYYEQSLHLCRETGDRRSEGNTLNNLAIIFEWQGDPGRSRSYAEQALDLAREIGDLRAAGKALVTLAMAALATGEWHLLRVHAEEGLEIARRVANRSSEGSLLLYLGDAALGEGQYARCRAYAEQALQVVREIGNHHLEVSALINLGESSLLLGDYSRAQGELAQALAIIREIGDRQQEPACLHEMGLLLHHLGDYEQAAGYYEQALGISRAAGDAVDESLVLATFGLLAYHRGDLAAALDYCRQALSVTRAAGGRPVEAQALTILGHALAGGGQLEEATVAYRDALALRHQLRQPHLAAEPRAGLARLALRRGVLEVASVEEILPCLQDGSVSGCDEPLRVYLTCYQVLRACQDPRAGDVLRSAYSLLQERAARIEDDGARRTFLEIAAHREVAAAFREHESAPPSRQLIVSLPRAGAPSGRPLRDDEYTTVTWTVDAPEDTAVRGKTARRHYRLRRLLEEARSQGAVPTQAHLAAALGVSRRTIERDAADLRQSPDGFPFPPLRGKVSE